MELTTLILSSFLPIKEKELLFGLQFSDPMESTPSEPIMENSYLDLGTVTSPSSIALMTNASCGKSVNIVSQPSLSKLITDNS